MRAHVILVALLGLIAAFIRLDLQAERSRAQLQQAQAAFAAAQSWAQARLVTKMRDLEAEKGWAEQWRWGLLNSVTQSLSAYIEPKVLDGLGLFSSDCQPLALASSRNQMAIRCQLPEGGKAEGFSWQTAAAGTSLVLTKLLRLRDGRELRAVAAVRIDQGWLNAQSGLAAYMQPLSLGLSQSLPVQLVALQPWFQILPGRWQSDATSLRQDILLLLLCALFITALLGGRTMLQQRLQQQAEANSTILVQKLAEQDDELRVAKGQQDNLDATIARLNSSLAVLEQEQSDNLRFRTLSLQLNATSSGLSTKLRGLEVQAQHLDTQLGQSLHDQATALQRLSQSWADGLASAQPRKFLRTLAERPSTEGTQLETQVGELLRLSQSTTALTWEVQEQAKVIACEAQGLSQLANFWHSLEQPNAGEHEQWLLDLVLEAQGLVNIVRGPGRLNFANQIESQLVVTPLGLAAATWVSVLYHLYAILAPSGGLVQTRATPRGAAMLLICSSDGNPAVVNSRHWQQAQRLLRHSALELILLPTLSGSAPIALRWSLDSSAQPEPTKRGSHHRASPLLQT